MPSTHRPAQRSLALLAVAGLFALCGCAPGSGTSAPKDKAAAHVSKDTSKAGKVTLTVWDAENGAGTNPVENALNKQFQAKYPNVTIHRTTRDFANLKTTLKLALSSNNPPDVVEVNQGYPDMGAFVKAGLIQPLDGYAQAYGWKSRIPQSARDLDSFAQNGQKMGQGSLYGIPQTGSLVSFYYNKKNLKKAGISAPPKTWQEFQADCAKIKQSGQTPIWFGNQDKYEAISLLATILDENLPASKVQDLVYGRGGSWSSPAVVNAAKTVSDFARKGYITPGANGLAGGQALSDFSKGKGVFYLDGDWDSQTLAKSMGSNVGMFLPPAGPGGNAAEGGQGGAWAITSKSKHADVAGSYINFLTTDSAEHMLSQKGNLPIVDHDTVQPPAGSVTVDVYKAWHSVNSDDGVTPYLDYSTPTFYDTLTNNLQDLIGGKTTPQKFTAALQQDYSSFISSR